ncbi:hypothetical protein BCR33DRAFT_662528, partial [Rhizoclosmatium globosum]
LISLPNIDLHLAHSFATAAVRIAKKDKELTPEMLEIDWKPLWELIRRSSFPRGRERVFAIDASYTQETLKLVRTVRRLFPPSATPEILEEFLPDVNPHNQAHMLNIVGHMTVFLPTNRVPSPIPNSTLDSSAPAFYWVPTLIHIWSLSDNSSHLDKSIMSTFARLAEDQVHAPHLCGWTDEIVRVVVECGLRDLDLPVGGSGGKKGKGSSALIPYLSRFLIWTLYPSSVNGYVPPTTSLTHLQTLLQAAETFFHPSNHGPWSTKLAVLLHHLSAGFLKRWRKESSPDCKTPASLRLTPELKRQFVETIQSCAFLSMFSKDPRAVSEANGAIKSLAYLEPEIVLPKVLERVFPALETLTETHRTSACLSNLGLTILPLLNRQLFPSGAKHFIDLLNLTLPGIDMNDPMKTTSTFVFISSAFMGVPIVDLSNSMVDDEETEDDRDVRFSTAAFEEWIVLFLNRIYVMFENLPQIHGSSDENTMEGVLLSMATYSLQIILQQTSPEIHELALKSLAKFVASNVIPSATKAVGKILSIAGGSFPAKKLHYFLPLTASRIREELASGASGKPSMSATTSFPFGFASLSDAALHWNQYAFMSTLAGTGSALLEHKRTVEGVIEDMVNGCKSFRGVKWGAKAIQAAVFTLSAVYPKDFRGFEGEQWNDPAFMASSYKRWGELAQASSFSVDWHIPTEAELDFAIFLASKYATRALNELESLIKASESTPVTSSDARRDQSFEFTRWILVLKSTLMSLGGLVAPWDDDTLSPLSSTPLLEVVCDLGKKKGSYPSVGYLPKTSPHHATVTQLRFKIGNMLHSLMRHFEKHREDDVAPLKQLIRGVMAFISYRGVKAGALAKQINGYKYIKGIVGSIESGKRLPRYLLVKRSQILHQHRIRFCFSHESILTVQIESLQRSLFDLSLSRYSEIRKEAQSALQQTMVPFDALKKQFYNMYMSRLVAPQAPEYVIKGCLFVAASNLVQEIARRDVKSSFVFIKAICMPFGDKPSTQEIVRSIFVSALQGMSQLSIGFEVPKSLIEGVQKAITVDQTIITKGASVVNQLNTDLKQLYSQFMTDMLDLIQLPSTHWRARAMAVNLLEVAWRPQDPQSLPLVQIVLEGVVATHPTFRDVCLSVFVRVLRSLKARAKAAGTIRTNVLKKEITRSPDNFVDTEAYLKEAVLEGVSGASLHDTSIVGWYCWPQKAKFYTLAGDDFDIQGGGLESLPYWDAESRDSLEAIASAIAQPEFWTKLSTYHSQESSKGSEHFNTDIFNLVRALAGQFEDIFVDHIKAIVVELVKDPKDKSKQRAAAELVSGIVRGSKNWSLQKRTKMWSWVMPIVSSAFQTATTETIRFWIELLNCVFANRDPRRVLPLIQFVFSWKLDPSAQSFFTESKKLTLLKIVVSSFKWRLLPLYPALLAELFSQVRHPYQQVRDVLGVLIDEVLQLLWYPAANSIGQVIQWNAVSHGGLHPSAYAGSGFNAVIPATPHPIVKPLADQLFADMDAWRKIERASNVAPSDYGNASKTVIAWLYGSLGRNPNTSKFTCLEYQIPEIVKMIEYDEAELQKSAAVLSTIYSHAPFPLHLLPRVIHQILDILAQPDLKWQVKLKLIPVLQIIFFKNLIFMTSELKQLILETVSGLLGHSQVEIRNLAGVTLSGLVRCSERSSISSLKAKFEAELKGTRAAKKKATLPPRTDGSESPTKESNSLHPLVVRRHAAVIGLSSLVLAFPYDVPVWMPEVLITLSTCISDQAPIAVTVSKTFADFRRTHQDTWKEEGMKAFTEDQLSILSDLLISSSYYA